MVGDCDTNLAIQQLHPGLVIEMESDEHDSLPPGLKIEGFPLTVGSEITVQHVDLGLWPELLELESALSRMGTANAAAIGTLGLTRADTLNENRRIHFLEGRIIAYQLSIQLLVSHDARVTPIAVNIGTPFAGPAGDDRDAML
jgi:hypothetical protein